MEKFTDIELILEYRQGQQAALTVLIKRYLGSLYGFVYRYVNNKQEAEDIVQETFVKVWQNLKKFKSDKSFKTWLYTIARNTAIDYLRRRSDVILNNFKSDEEGDDSWEIVDKQPLPSELFIQKELKERLSKALGHLPLNQQEVILWHLEQDFTFQEIADSLGQSINTVKSRYRRGVASLRQLLLG